MKSANTNKRLASIIKRLRRKYSKPRTALYHGSPYEILVATILSAQCTDNTVNKITPFIFRKYKDAYGFSKAKRSALEKEIRPCGFYRNKAKNIIDASKIIMDDFGGNVPDNMRDLLALPGVARKTANIVLSSGFKKAEGIAVDTHVKRISGRLGLSKHKDPVKIEKDLLRIVPKKDWIDFNYMLVNHGRDVCKARKPVCGECLVGDLCPSFKCYA